MTEEIIVNELYLALAGEVNLDMVRRVFNSFSAATQRPPDRVHLLLHSTGGFVNDGIGIYNFLKNLPLEIVAYNGGNVSSIATVIFLAANKRVASQTATFMIHKVHVNPAPGVRPASLKLIAEAIEADDIRTEHILREHLTLPDDKWAIHAYADLHINAHEAVTCGLIHEIGDFKPPRGSQVFSI